MGACARMVVTYGPLKMTPAAVGTFWDARERERETDDVYYVRVDVGMDE